MNRQLSEMGAASTSTAILEQTEEEEAKEVSHYNYIIELTARRLKNLL